MPFGGLLTAAIIGGVSTIAGSAVSNSAGAKTSTQTPLYTQGQTSIQNQLQQSLSNQLTNPGINLDPLQATATGQVNQNYAGLGNSMTEQLTQRGFGRSGTLASNQQQLDLSRQGDLGNLASKFAGYQLDQQNKVEQQAQQFGFANPGQTDVGNHSAFGAGLGAVAGLAGGALGVGGGLGALLSGGSAGTTAGGAGGAGGILGAGASDFTGLD